MVVEIASLNEDPPPEDAYFVAVVQLQNYLEIVGERWHQRLVGLAILGNRAYLMHITEDNHHIRDIYEPTVESDDDDQQRNWMSLFDPRVVEVLDEMYELSINDDDVDEDSDEDEEDVDDD